MSEGAPKEEENFGGTPKPLTDDEIEVIHRLFAKHDKSGDKQLQFEEFLAFIKACYNADLDQDPNGDVNEAEEEYDCNVKQFRYLYQGMDVDGSGSVSEYEICQCFAALKEKNTKWLAKIIFRGADKDRSRKISVDEVSDLVSVCVNGFTEEQFIAKCKEEFGEDTKELTFAQFYKLVVGETISDNVDPYDGKLKKSSKCCFLL